MKRLVYLTMVLVTTVSVTGCQSLGSLGFGKRGARCGAQADVPMYAPGFGQSSQSMQGPGCKECNSNMQSGTVVIPDGGTITDDMQTVPMGTQRYRMSPMSPDGSQPVVVDRQIVPGSVTVRDADTNAVISIPGTESAPIPRS